MGARDPWEGLGSPLGWCPFPMKPCPYSEGGTDREPCLCSGEVVEGGAPIVGR